LPHFSRVATYAPKRLSFYFLETVKFIGWITIPASLFMIFFADKIFLTFSTKFTADQAVLGAHILVAYVMGLFIFSLNKILPNLYYAFHVTWIPAVASLVCGALNIGLDLVLMHFYQAVGLALAYTIAATLQVCILVYLLKKRFQLRLYLQPFAQFIACYLLQLGITSVAFVKTYYLCETVFARYATGSVSSFLLNGVGLWLWVSPLVLISALFIFKTRHLFGIKIHFLD
jgi:peptidoglycan biosynthesis protein MviN/MurJ (putative lipid II flippase)